MNARLDYMKSKPNVSVTTL